MEIFSYPDRKEDVGLDYNEAYNDCFIVFCFLNLDSRDDTRVTIWFIAFTSDIIKLYKASRST